MILVGEVLEEHHLVIDSFIVIVVVVDDVEQKYIRITIRTYSDSIQS